MLSLTRKAGERVAIGPDVIVKVLEVVAGRVRLGIEVPPGTLIRRGEAPGPAALASRLLATGPALHA
jgi:carbon storage regulator CsrA